MPGKAMSLVNTASPVTFATASRRRSPLPIWASSAGFVFSRMFQLSLAGEFRLPRRVEHGFDDLLVPGAAAEIAFDAFLDLIHRGLGNAPEKLTDRQDHTSRAVAALDRVMPIESLLDRGELSFLRLAFDRFHRGTVGLHRQHHAGVDGLAVEENRAGAAFAGAAAFLGARQSYVFAEKSEQGPVLLDVAFIDPAVDREPYLHAFTSASSRRTYTSTMYSRYSFEQRTSLMALMDFRAAATTFSTSS